MLDHTQSCFSATAARIAIVSDPSNSQEMKTRKNYRAILRVNVVHKSSKHLMLAEEVPYLNTFCLCAFRLDSLHLSVARRHHFPGSKGRVYLASLKMGFLTDDFSDIYLPSLCLPLCVARTCRSIHHHLERSDHQPLLPSFIPPLFHRQKRSLASAEGFVGRQCFPSLPL